MKISTKKLMKILTIFLIIAMVVSFSTPIFAAEIQPNGLQPTYGDDGGLSKKAGQIMGMIRNIAVIAAVIVIMVIGVKYILGSVEEKAEYKKNFMPLIIGIILVVAATSIASFIFNMAK